MKKRRELDAIASRMKPKRNGTHEFLRSSSENEELLQSDRENLSNCYIFSILFHLVIIIIGFASVGSLLWLLMQLKSQVKDLKMQLFSVSSENEAMNQRLQDMSAKCLQTNVWVGELKSAVGKVQVATAFRTIGKQIASLSAQTASSDASVKKLSQLLAEMDGGLKTYENKVDELKTSLFVVQQEVERTSDYVGASSRLNEKQHSVASNETTPKNSVEPSVTPANLNPPHVTIQHIVTQNNKQLDNASFDGAALHNFSVHSRHGSTGKKGGGTNARRRRGVE